MPTTSKLPPTPWQPVLAAQLLVAGAAPVALRLQGENLVAWRSADGAAQVWLDRCPHRGVPLSLGRIVDGHLSCVYHGWEFEAGSGRCVRVPALDDLAQVPGKVQVRRWQVREAGGMLWVRPGAEDGTAAGDGDTDGGQPEAAPASPAADPAAAPGYLRALALQAPRTHVAAVLRAQGGAEQPDGSWLAGPDRSRLRLFLQAADQGSSFAHAWLTADAAAGAGAAAVAFAWLRQLRALAEAPAAPQPSPAGTAGEAAFCTDDPNVRAEWVTVGPAAQLAGRSATDPARTQLLGVELQLWRDAHGAPCCRTATQQLAICERYAYLWVCTSGTPRRPLFALPEFADPQRRIVDCAGLGVGASGLRVVENFLDMGHFPYVHGGTLGRVPQTVVEPYRVEEDPASGELWALDCRFHQPQASASASGGIDAQYRYRVMHPLCAALYKSSPARPGAFDVIGLFLQPLDAVRVRAHCLLLYYEDVLSDAELIRFQHHIFGQDKPILESQRPHGLPLDGPHEQHMRSDLASVRYRRWLRARGMVFGTRQGEA